jgi:superoxide dismutase, Fe-Mn family
MIFELYALPYEMSALEPYISEKTMAFHYGKHHLTYLNNLRSLIADTPMADKTLTQIVLETTGQEDKKAVFNNAAQVWNHSFFWASMKKNGAGEIKDGDFKQALIRDFGSVEAFKENFKKQALSLFGSGWVWLVKDKEKDRLEIVTTSNADNPLTKGKIPLLVADVWEHAYYLDYQNRRGDFIQAYLDSLVNWNTAIENYNWQLSLYA